MKRFIIKNPETIFGTQYEEDIDYSVPSHLNLDQICEAFTHFLKACGYQIDGQYVTLDYYDDLK